MALQLLLELESISDPAVQLDIVLSRNGQGLAVLRERMVRNGVVEEVVDFGRSHCCDALAIGVALNYRWVLDVYQRSWSYGFLLGDNGWLSPSPEAVA